MLQNQFGFLFRNVFDTMLASKVTYNGLYQYKYKNSLEAIVLRELKIQMEKEEQTSNWGLPVLTDKQISYAAMDVDVLHDLFIVQTNMGAPHDLTVNGRTMETLNLLPTFHLEGMAAIATARLELDGCYVDKAIWDTEDLVLRSRYHDVKGRLLTLLDNAPNIDLDSPLKMKTLIANILGLTPVPKPKKGQRTAAGCLSSTEAKVLKQYAGDHPEVALFIEYKKLAKLLTSYGNGAPDKKRKKDSVFFMERIHPITGRVHAEFDQMGTETGRYSCRKPNIEQIPDMRLAKFKTAFNGQPLPDGDRYVFIDADYSQMELRILAELSQDAALIEAFNSGVDVHVKTAAMMFNVPVESIVAPDGSPGPNYWMRSAAKSINFGLIYGRGNKSLGEQIGVDRVTADEYIRAYFNAYPGVERYLQQSAAFGAKNRFTRTPFGRIRYLPHNGTNREIADAEREAKNTPIQGANGDIIKKALYNFVVATEHYGNLVYLANVVHDEICVEAHPAVAEEVANILVVSMASAAEELIKSVPVVVSMEMGLDWSVH